MGKPVILAVDDDVSVLEMVVQDLRRQYGANYRIQRAASGQAALDTCDQLKKRGDVVAQEVTVRGHVKGTIRAVRVRLEDGATVEGDIFHRSLSIDEGAMFEGSSRRVENPTNAPTSIPEEIQHGAPAQAAIQPQAAVQPEAAIDAGLLAEPTGEMARTVS